MDSKEIELTYDNIQREAESFAARYRNEHDVPSFPSGEQVAKYRNILLTKFALVVELVRQRASVVDSEGGHGLEHLEDITTRAGFIAEDECEFRQITGEKRKQIIDKVILAGILHDIERHLGFGEEHMVEGQKTANKILLEAGIKDNDVLVVVRNHDHIDFNPGENLILEVVFGAVWDADHFRYGLEREDTFWRMKEKRGKPAQEVIHDYQFLPPYRDSWRTRYGKEVGPKYIDFGLAIARHIEEVFSIS